MKRISKKEQITRAKYPRTIHTRLYLKKLQEERLQNTESESDLEEERFDTVSENSEASERYFDPQEMPAEEQAHSVASKPLDRKVEVLNTLEADQVKEFQHFMRYTSRVGSRRALMSQKVLDTLVNDGVDVSSEDQISGYLDQIIADDMEGSTKSGLKYFKRKLKWPKNEPNAKLAIGQFIRSAQNLKKYVKNYDSNERIQEKVMKIVCGVLPYQFNLDITYIRENPRLLQFEHLSSFLRENSRCLDIKPKKKSKAKRLMQKLLESGDFSTSDSELSLSSGSDDPYDTAQDSAEVRRKKINRVQVMTPAEQASNSQLEAQVQELTLLVNRLQVDPTCYQCGEKGHIKPNCPKLTNGGAQNGGNINTTSSQQQAQVSGGQMVSSQPVVNQMDSNLAMMNLMQRMMDMVTSATSKGNGTNSPNQKVFHVNRLQVGNVLPRATVELLDPQGQWQVVKGILDSGSGTTCGSLQHHRRFFSQVTPVTNVVKLRLVTKDEYNAVEVGKITVRVSDLSGNSRIFRRQAMVFLVDHPQWEEFIIGYPTLKAEGLLPEQQLATRN